MVERISPGNESQTVKQADTRAIMCVPALRPSSSIAHWWVGVSRANGWLSGVSNHRRTHDSPRRGGGCHDVLIVRIRSKAYGVVGGSDNRVKLVTSIVLNIGVRGGSSAGFRKSASKVNARVGAP